MSSDQVTTIACVCGRIRMEIFGNLTVGYLFRCHRCKKWNTREGATMDKPEHVLDKS